MESQATKLAEYTNSLGWKQLSPQGGIKACGVSCSSDGPCALGALGWQLLSCWLCAPSPFPVTSWALISPDMPPALLADPFLQAGGCSAPQAFPPQGAELSFPGLCAIPEAPQALSPCCCFVPAELVAVVSIV